MATYLQPEQPSLLSVFGREESQVLNFHVEPNHIASMLQYHLICSVNLSDMNVISMLSVRKVSLKRWRNILSHVAFRWGVLVWWLSGGHALSSTHCKTWRERLFSSLDFTRSCRVREFSNAAYQSLQTLASSYHSNLVSKQPWCQPWRPGMIVNPMATK